MLAPTPKPTRSGTMSNERSKIAKVTDDCFAAIVRDYLASPKFKGYSESTQDVWGRELRFVAAPDVLGAVSRFEIRPALVQAVIDGLSGRPGKQNALYAALKQLEKWAVVRDILPRQITLGVECEDSDNGHVPWSEEHVALAERYVRSDLRRAITLGANTGQRGSDLVRMGWADIETFKGVDGIHLIQKKTGKDVWVPITSPLATAMKTWERQPGPFLRRLDGALWTRHDLSNAWMYERRINPELAALGAPAVAGKKTNDAGLVIHGLRGTACVRLLRAGANTRQIADMIGMSEPMVARYTRLSAQQENASAAVYHLERTLREQKNDMSNRGGA